MSMTLRIINHFSLFKGRKNSFGMASISMGRKWAKIYVARGKPIRPVNMALQAICSTNNYSAMSDSHVTINSLSCALRHRHLNQMCKLDNNKWALNTWGINKFGLKPRTCVLIELIWKRKFPYYGKYLRFLWLFRVRCTKRLANDFEVCS